MIRMAIATEKLNSNQKFTSAVSDPSIHTANTLGKLSQTFSAVKFSITRVK